MTLPAVRGSGVFLRPGTLSWLSAALVAIAGILAAAVSSPNATPAQRIGWIGVAVLGQAAFTLVYLLGRAVGLSRTRWGVLLTVVVAAASRGVTLAVVIPLIDAGDPLDPVSRVISATVTFTGWGVLVGAAVQGSQNYREDLRVLMTRVDLTIMQADEFARGWTARLSAATTSPADLAVAAGELQRDIAERLRPLSHRLWFGLTRRESRRLTFRKLGEEPPPIVWIAVIGFAGYLWNATYRFGVASAVLAGLLVTIGPVVMLLLGNLLASADPVHRVGWRVLSFVLAPVSAGVSSYLVYGVPEYATIVVVIISDAGIIVAAQAISVFLRHRRQTLAELEGRVDELDEERVSMAAHLHSTVQSRWNAAALQFQLAAESGDHDQAERALAQTRDLLSIVQTPSDEEGSLEDLALAWEGIAVIHLDVAEGIPEECSGTIGRLVDEAVANAVRHGRAHNVTVQVRRDDSDVEVIVSDDGIGIPSGAAPGLGSTWRSRVSTWELERRDVGSRLTARIPL